MCRQNTDSSLEFYEPFHAWVTHKSKTCSFIDKIKNIPFKFSGTGVKKTDSIKKTFCTPEDIF